LACDAALIPAASAPMTMIRSVMDQYTHFPGRCVASADRRGARHVARRTSRLVTRPAFPLPPPAGAAIISSLTSPPSRKSCHANAEHSFIVTVMKPVVHVPWYQVRPRILSGGADS
jgi:hypothetical protein